MKHAFMGAVSAALLLGALPAAHAAPTLSLSADGQTATCTDNDPTCDASTAWGEVTYIGVVGSFTTNITTGFTKPSIEDGNPLIDILTGNIENTGGDHTLVIKFSDDGFTMRGLFTGELGGTLSGAATVQGAAYYSTGNGTQTFIGQTDVLGPGILYGTFTGPYAPSSPYSLTQIISLSTTGPGKTFFSGDFEVNLPEPTTPALLGLGLVVGFAATRRRRQAT